MTGLFYRYLPEVESCAYRRGRPDRPSKKGKRRKKFPGRKCLAGRGGIG